MGDYFAVKPLGLESSEIESFGSVFCRWSRAHSVSQYVMARHLAEWWDRRALGPPLPASTIGGNAQFCSMGNTVAAYVAAMTAATGCAEFRRSTLLALAPAAPRTSIGYTRRIRAWCPGCLHEARRGGLPFYDRLVWALPLVTRCMFHKVALVQTCPNCATVQKHYSADASLERCWKCSSDLLSCSSSWEKRLHPSFGESQCHELIEAIAQGELVEAKTDAVQLFCRELRQQLDEHGLNYRELYGEKIGVAVMGTKRPILRWMIHRAAVSQVRVSDMLNDPIGAARSTCLLGLRPQRLSPRYRPKKALSVIRVAEERLKAELAKGASEAIPPTTQLVQELGVSKGLMEYRFPALWRRYKDRVIENRKQKTKADELLGRGVLSASVLSEYPYGRFCNLKSLAKHVSEQTGINISIARRVAADAVRPEGLGARGRRGTQKLEVK